MIRRLVISVVCCFAWSLTSLSLAETTVDGFTEPFRKIDLAPAEPGTIAEVCVKEGDAVVKDQLVASLDTDALSVSLQIAKVNQSAHGRLDAATAERDLRQLRLEKLEDLRRSGNASGEELDRARAELAVSEANVLTAEETQAVNKLEVDKNAALIERRMIRSPIDGLVVTVHRDQKEYVSPNNPIVVTVVQLDPLRATFRVPTAEVSSLHVGQTAPVLLNDGNTRVTGTIDWIAPVTEAESGTVRVNILLDNHNQSLRSGVPCSLSLEGVK